jgi:hypothetical protein
MRGSGHLLYEILPQSLGVTGNRRLSRKTEKPVMVDRWTNLSEMPVSLQLPLGPKAESISDILRGSVLVACQPPTEMGGLWGSNPQRRT